ncbi:hypothetical protein TNCV_569881 [Trichonephila clavipes]|nr:hypothetical protein TNCV_569881 [Trichonephila clavipes]
MQPKAKHSLRAQAQLMRTETVETFELVKVKQKLLGRAEKEREAAKENARDSPGLHTADSVRSEWPLWIFLVSFELVETKDIRAEKEKRSSEGERESEANPQVYVETPLHPEKLTVWCALWAGGILLQKR